VNPKVTVYIPSRNYGKFLREALASVVSQSFQSWELIVFTEGSVDETIPVAREFRDQFPERITIVETAEPLGLRVCANQALEMARGEYIVRLDADDFFDESALLVLSDHLDRHPDVGIVYPNWVYINESGEILGVERRRRIQDEPMLPGLPPHGACTMIRKRVLKSVGGYDTRFDAQDGHEIWLRTLHRFKMANVQTPLFFYRQHEGSMSADVETLLAARRAIKKAIASRYAGPVKPRCAAIIPVMHSRTGQGHALQPLAGRALIDYTLDCASACSEFALIYVSTDDPQLVAHCAGRDTTATVLRRPGLSDPGLHLEEVVRAAIDDMETNLDFDPDMIAVLNVHAPLRRPEHVQEAVHTLLMHEVDQVVSTFEDDELHYVHGHHGLEPINPGARRGLRLERQALFTANEAVHLFWRDAIRTRSMYTGRVGHIVMSRTDSLQTSHPEDRARVEILLAGRHAGAHAT
jgi:CMP-N-acetylneuraminic acid synthetase